MYCEASYTTHQWIFKFPQGQGHREVEMTAKITFHPLGNADCTRIDLSDGQKLLIDFADVRNTDDPSDQRIDLSKELKDDLRASNRDGYEVVLFTHLDDDHCHGACDFFWFDHAIKYQGTGRVKIRELWVPAAAILDEGSKDSARVVRQEARYRLRKGNGIRVFSRPDKLKDWLVDNGLTLESREHLITDAGQYVPDYSTDRPEKVRFFIHSPFGWRQDEEEIIDRNQDSVVFQATFVEGHRETHAMFMSDIDYESIDQIVETTKRHDNAERLIWDVFKIPHHCSYLSVGPEKGDEETKPSEGMEWLCETHGRVRSIMMSTSDSIPVKGSDEDKNPQPPHRQAAAYYKHVASKIDGNFKVTMDLPSPKRPKPSTVEITSRGATLVGVSVMVGASNVTTSTTRAG